MSENPELRGPAVDAENQGVTEDAVAEMYASTFRHIREGEIVQGTVVSIEGESVLVDIGYKSEGYIPKHEFPEGGRGLRVGDPVEVYLEVAEDTEGLIVLSKEKANRIKIWEEIEKIYDSNGVVEGEVVSRIKGGLTVDIGLKAFLPGSQVDLRPVRNLDKLLGQRFQMKIIKLNRKRGNIVLSRRLLLEQEREEIKKKTLATLREGQVMEGVVKNITDYGCFVDLGGIDGLLHITDMTWGRIGHPTDLFNIGDRVQVMVLKFDPQTERVSLGHKQTSEDPWTNSDQKYPAGTRVRGKVVSLTDYGAFVELEEGVEGLVHVSEMSWTKKVRKPSKLVELGQIIDAAVLNIDMTNRRISLGMKQVQPNPWHVIADKYPLGSMVRGRVRNLTDFGAFVTLEEGIDGLIHISDLSWTQRIKHPSEVLKKGQEVEVKVLKIDVESERLSLGFKQMGEDPWTRVEKKYHVGDNVHCTIVKLTSFGAFAELEEGVEGLIHVSEMSRERVTEPGEVVSAEQRVLCKIIKVDVTNKKIGLSIKAAQEDEEEVDLASYNASQQRQEEAGYPPETEALASDQPAEGTVLGEAEDSEEWASGDDTVAEDPSSLA